MTNLSSKKGIAKVTKKSEKLQNEISEKIISDNLHNVSDETIFSNLKDVNIEKLISQSSNANRSIWTKESKAKFKTEKAARSKLRNEQYKLCKSVIVSLNVYKTLRNAEKEMVLNDACKALLNFSKLNLINVKNFSNKSDQSEQFNTIHSAYKTTFQILKIN